MPPPQEQSMSYTTLKLRHSVQEKPYCSLWDFILDIYILGKKMEMHIFMEIHICILIFLFKQNIKMYKVFLKPN